MKFFLLCLAGVAIGVNIFCLLVWAYPPKQEIQNVVETKYITEKEYIKVNQSEPMEMSTTAYTAGPESTGKRPGMKGYGITFTGTKVRPGVCAVDPHYINLGSSLYIQGVGYCRAEDTGSKVKGYHIDVFMDKVSDALKFGRENRKVWILNDFGEE